MREDLDVFSGSNAEQLLGYVARLEALDAQIDDINKKKSEAYKELRFIGFHKETVKKLVQRRKTNQPDHAAGEQRLSDYMAAINQLK